MGRCLSPFYKKDTGLSFPCGKCAECKAARISGWTFRLMKEAERSTSALFITLTYEIPPLTEKGLMTLDKRDPVLFIKKIRKKHHINDNTKLKYYLAGEYGTKGDRPHYHIILFNANLSDLIGKQLATQIELGNLTLDGKTPMQIKAWQHGHSTIGELTEGGASYTCKYISKTARIPKFIGDDRTPEYSNMSKGIGDNYPTESIIKWHRADILNRMYIPLKDGKAIKMPRYYKKHFYTELEREEINKHLITQSDKEENKKSLGELKNDELIRIAKGHKNDETRQTKI
jgi:hypothetical protein